MATVGNPYVGPVLGGTWYVLIGPHPMVISRLSSLGKITLSDTQPYGISLTIINACKMYQIYLLCLVFVFGYEVLSVNFPNLQHVS